MLKEERETLGGHLGFHLRALQSFSKINEIIHGHFFCKLRRPGVGVMSEKIAEFLKVIAFGSFTVLA